MSAKNLMMAGGILLTLGLGIEATLEIIRGPWMDAGSCAKLSKKQHKCLNEREKCCDGVPTTDNMRERNSVEARLRGLTLLHIVLGLLLLLAGMYQSGEFDATKVAAVSIAIILVLSIRFKVYLPFSYQPLMKTEMNKHIEE